MLDLFLVCFSFFSLMGAAGGSTFSISNWSNCMLNLKNRSCVSIELCPTSTHCNCHLELHTPQGDFICRQVNERNKLTITTKSSLSAITTTTQKIPSFCWNLSSSIYLQDSYALNKLANWFLRQPYTHSWWPSYLFQKLVFWFWWMKKVFSRKFYRKKFLNFAGFWWWWLKKTIYDFFGWVGVLFLAFHFMCAVSSVPFLLWWDCTLLHGVKELQYLQQNCSQQLKMMMVQQVWLRHY